MIRLEKKEEYQKVENLVRENFIIFVKGKSNIYCSI